MPFTLLSLCKDKCYSQNVDILEFYPIAQSFYPGGISELEKHVIKITKKLQLKPCENSSEYYGAKIIVFENSSIAYAKDFDTVNISKNKCAFDYSRKIIPHLKNWMDDFTKWKSRTLNGIAYSSKVRVPIRQVGDLQQENDFIKSIPRSKNSVHNLDNLSLR